MIKFKSPKGQKNHKAVINTMINLQRSSIFSGILTCYPRLHIFLFPTTTEATRKSAFSLSTLAKSWGRTAPPEAAHSQLSTAQHRPPGMTSSYRYLLVSPDTICQNCFKYKKISFGRNSIIKISILLKATYRFSANPIKTQMRGAEAA